MKIYFKKKVSLIIILILFYFVYTPLFIYKEIYNNIGYNYDLNETLFQAAKHSHYFVSNSHNGILTQKIPYKINKNPELSVIIPMFNSEKYIKRAILSVQNQNYTNFELIIINDCSIDNSIKIVNKLSRTDKRIKIINNIKNMGLFYSRCIGVLESKGKYILPLDSDDMYLVHDTLYFTSIELKKNNIDFLMFRGILSFNYSNFFINKDLKLFRDDIKRNEIIYQPSIGKNCYMQCSLQATCIFHKLYRKAINVYGKIHLYDHITYFEDCIMNYIIHQYAESFEKYIKIGYLYIYRESSSSHTESYINKIKSQIYYIEVLYNYSKYSKENRLLGIRDLIDLMKTKHFKEAIEDQKIKALLNSLLDLIKLDKSVSTKNKTFIELGIA